MSFLLPFDLLHRVKNASFFHFCISIRAYISFPSDNRMWTGETRTAMGTFLVFTAWVVFEEREYKHRRIIDARRLIPKYVYSTYDYTEAEIEAAKLNAGEFPCNATAPMPSHLIDVADRIIREDLGYVVADSYWSHDYPSFFGHMVGPAVYGRYAGKSSLRVDIKHNGGWSYCDMAPTAWRIEDDHRKWRPTRIYVTPNYLPWTGSCICLE